MPELPTTLSQLMLQWQDLLTELGHHNGQHIADNMTNTLAGNIQWRDWYQHNAQFAELIDLITDIELPPQHRLLVHDESHSWQKIRELITELLLAEKPATDNS
jgi:hypothetical protein